MFKKVLPYVVVSLFLFLLFVAFSYFVHKDFFTQIDFDTTVRLQNNIPRRLDHWFSLLSLVGNFQNSLIFLVIVLLIRRKVLVGIIAFSSFGFLHVFELYGKTFVDHLPPPHFMLRTEKFNFPEFYIRLENSYPSGHLARAAFLTVFLGMWIMQMKKIPLSIRIGLLLVLIGYDCAMLISRIYLGEHWTSDVIGGALLGAGFGVLSMLPLSFRKFAKAFKKKQSTS